jgi:CheY-like chemotaxis protein
MAYILLVDDDNDFRNVLKIMLTRLGHTPTLTARGEDGLAQAVASKFDLVILDLMLPDIDGYEVAQRLRNAPRTRNIPILVITARSQAADREMAMQAGVDGYLTKPVDPRELANKVTEMLSLNRAESAAPPAAEKLGGGPVAAAIAGSAPSAPGAVSGAKPAAPTQTLPTGPPPNGRVFVALGLRGGVGTTTFAVNLAGVMSRAGRRVCLVDLSPSSGHVTLHLRLRPRATWADLPPLIDSGVVAQFVTRHDSGVFVVAAPPQPVRASLPNDAFQVLLYHLRNFFTDVVVDSAPMLDDPTVAALNVCKQALVVINPDVATVQATLGTLRVLPTLGLSEAQIKLVLNTPAAETGIPSAAVEKALGRSVDVTIPFDKQQNAALVQGLPLFTHQGSTPLVAAIASFAVKL